MDKERFYEILFFRPCSQYGYELGFYVLTHDVV